MTGGLDHGRTRSRWGLGARLVVLIVGLWLGPWREASGASPPGSRATEAELVDALDACRRGIEKLPVSRLAAWCFYEVARQQERWDEVYQELSARVAEPGASPMLLLPLGFVEGHRGNLERAAELLGEALEAMPDATADTRAQLFVNRGLYLRKLGRHAEARAAYEEVVELGRIHDIAVFEVAGQLELGSLLLQQGGDLGELRALYDRVVPLALDVASYSVGTKALIARATLWRRLGQDHRRRQDYEQILSRAQQQGDAYDELFARSELLGMELEALDLRDGGQVPPPLRQRLAQLRRQAQDTHQAASVNFLWCQEAQLLAGAGRAGQAAQLYERCADGHGETKTIQNQLVAQLGQALALSRAGDHAHARSLAEAVDAQARAHGLRELQLNTGYGHIVTAMNAGAVPRALERAGRHFDDVELYREIQSDEADRSQEMSELSTSYYFVSGSLLRQRGDPAGELDTAFGVIERMRARNLLDGLRRSRALRSVSDLLDVPDEQRWRETVAEIAAVQRSLLRSGLDQATRDAVLLSLEQLEAQERRLRTVLGHSGSELGRLLVPQIPTLPEIQATLGARDAILSFQLADEYDRLGGPEGGSWLWVITRDAVQVVPLPERRVLDRQLAFVAGLFTRRDGREAEPMARLHRDLLAPALALLPPAIDRLVIVPDGALWSLPFAALRPTAEDEPLVSRYSLSLVPSVTSWMRWGARAGEVAPGLLALAQPQLELGQGAATYRQGTLASGLQLGALPRARQEVEAIVRIWSSGWGSGDSTAEVGERASERFLKGSDLSKYGLLHFATHAVMDPRFPDRSAVVLAAGGEDEDGLLQAREIVRLPLDGKVVVLSACSGAAGAFVRGEGVMSLARAFLQGGAQAVVASRWPLADADAMALFERLYLHLDEGLSLADALARAQRDLIEAGAPAAAWAGVVVLGRGDRVLVARPWWWRWRREWIAAGALLALLGGIGLALGARRRVARRSMV
ncbi:MAG: CHAT domain-containing protein [Myxococcota bacterium]